MKNKRLQKLSLAVLIISILPLATFIPILFHITLTDGVRSIWAGVNIFSVLVGLILSIICVKSRDSQSLPSFSIETLFAAKSTDAAFTPCIPVNFVSIFTATVSLYLIH